MLTCEDFSILERFHAEDLRSSREEKPFAVAAPGPAGTWDDGCHSKRS